MGKKQHFWMQLGATRADLVSLLHVKQEDDCAEDASHRGEQAA